MSTRATMPLTFSEEGEELADKSPCALMRAQLKYCLLDSDCCKKVSAYAYERIAEWNDDGHTFCENTGESDTTRVPEAPR